MSHETIYQSLYVQGRGGLRRELTQHLRTGRVEAPTPGPPAGAPWPDPWNGQHQRKARRGRRPGRARPLGGRPDHRLGRVQHRDRDPGGTGHRVRDPAAPAHGHGALAVQEAMCAAMAELPATLRRTLTWDQGGEMRHHLAIADATGLQIYFCDPHSPWQRGSNENTNGLLRQYFPKGTDLSFHGPGILANVADELNNRPRKRHNWATPVPGWAERCTPTPRDGRRTRWRGTACWRRGRPSRRRRTARSATSARPCRSGSRTLGPASPPVGDGGRPRPSRSPGSWMTFYRGGAARRATWKSVDGVRRTVARPHRRRLRAPPVTIGDGVAVADAAVRNRKDDHR